MAQALYQTVYDAIVAKIANGSLTPGELLPSEADIGLEYGVSQGTARKAFSELEKSGIVKRFQGKGTFITSLSPENALFHFLRLRRDDGTQAIPKLEHETLKKRTATDDEKIQLFGLPEFVYEIDRVRSIDGKNIIHEVSIMPADLFPGLMERAPLPNTIYDLYQRAFGCVIVQADENLRATIANSTITKALNLEANTPVLVAERKAIDLVGRCVELRVSHYITNDLNYHIELR